MWKKIALGILVLGILCMATGFAVVATQTSFSASKDAARHAAVTGNEGGSGKSFSYSPLGDEGGPAKPFGNGTI